MFCNADSIINKSNQRVMVNNGTDSNLCLHLRNEERGEVVTASCDLPNTRWIYDENSGIIHLNKYCLGVSDFGESKISCPKNSFYTDPSTNGACQSMQYEIKSYACDIEVNSTISLLWNFDSQNNFFQSNKGSKCLTSIGPFLYIANIFIITFM